MLETPEEKDAFRHVEQMAKHFAGNYQGPLYAPHPDIKREEKEKRQLGTEEVAS